MTEEMIQKNEFLGSAALEIMCSLEKPMLKFSACLDNLTKGQKTLIIIGAILLGGGVLSLLFLKAYSAHTIAMAIIEAKKHTTIANFISELVAALVHH